MGLLGILLAMAKIAKLKTARNKLTKFVTKQLELLDATRPVSALTLKDAIEECVLIVQDG